VSKGGDVKEIRKEGLVTISRRERGGDRKGWGGRFGEERKGRRHKSQEIGWGGENRGGGKRE